MSIYTLWGWKSSSERPMHAFSLNLFLRNVNVLYFHNSIMLRKKKKKNTSFLLSEGLLKGQIYPLTTKAMALDIFDPRSLHHWTSQNSSKHNLSVKQSCTMFSHKDLHLCLLKWKWENIHIHQWWLLWSYRPTDWVPALKTLLTS